MQVDVLIGVYRSEHKSRQGTHVEGMKSLSDPLGKQKRDLVSPRQSTMSPIQQQPGISMKAQASPLATASAEPTDSRTASRLA
jgi:hypothetical protein